jgi:hypothetical protein
MLEIRRDMIETRREEVRLAMTALAQTKPLQME